MRYLLGAAVMSMLLAAGPAAGQDDDNKMYKWVDEDGNVTYQDQPPPDDSGQVQAFDESPVESTGGAQDAALPDVDLTLYSIEACDACDLVRNLLSERGLPFTEKDAESDVAVQEELREVSGALSVPALAIGDEVLTGFNRELILRVLEDYGFPASADARAQSEPARGEMSREELEQAARDAGDEDDPFDDDFFSDLDTAPAGDDISDWEEIPEDERIRVGE